MDNAIIERIKKLLALGERAGTEAEAELAMSRAHELLAKHNLSIGEVKGAAEEEAYDTEKFDIQRGGPWQRQVYAAICKLYFCEYYMESCRGHHKHCVIGKPSNIAIASYLSEYIIRTAKKMSLEAYLEHYPEGSKSAYCRSYRKGFAARIALRSREQLAAAQTNKMRDAGGNALILHPLYERTSREIGAYKDSINLRLKTGKSRQQAASNPSAWGRGHEAAGDVSLTANGLHARQATKQLA